MLSMVATMAVILTAATVIPAQTPKNTDVPKERFARLTHGINLSHWYAQSGEGYADEHLRTYNNETDIRLIRQMGFNHVRLTLEPTILWNGGDPTRLDVRGLREVERAVQMVLAEKLAVIVDIHPGDDFKKRCKEEEFGSQFALAWETLAKKLGAYSPDSVFFETMNEPVFNDAAAWQAYQGKLIAAIRRGAPRHTIIASGDMWSGVDQMGKLQPYSDRNVVYNFHCYDPFVFTHQGASWAGQAAQGVARAPYPSSPEAVAKVLDLTSREDSRSWLESYGKERWNAQKLVSHLKPMADWARTHGVYITCNEFGAYRAKADAAERNAYLRDIRTALEGHGIGWCMWDYAGGFAVALGKSPNRSPDPETVQALGLTPSR